MDNSVIGHGKIESKDTHQLWVKSIWYKSKVKWQSRCIPCQVNCGKPQEKITLAIAYYEAHTMRKKRHEST